MKLEIPSFLDWKRSRLFVYESRKNIILVNAIGEAIERGEKIKPVYVIQTNPNTFFLSGDGHHRALAHYVLGSPLPIIAEQFPTSNILFGYFPIGDTLLFDHRTDCKRLEEQWSEQLFLEERLYKYPGLNHKPHLYT